MLSTVVLRDDRETCWYVYRQPVSVISTHHIDNVLSKLSEIEAKVEQQSLYAAGFVGYEAAPAFDNKMVTRAPGRLPLLYFGLFASRERLDVLPQVPPRLIRPWQMQTTRSDYEAQVNTIKAHIGAGDTYQVNYTQRLQTTDVVDYESFLAAAAQAPYAAFVSTSEFDIVSASPELFFELAGDCLVCKPMKGTAKRGLSSAADAAQAAWLQQSEKNRAENLMITDMVRNDLGRIAEPGSVRVPDLFEVARYPAVWQMTSTVQAQSSASVVDIFRALFPAASITGAPKHASMSYIKALETSPREVYTGAIGVIAPNRQARFNIAIRTAWSDKRQRRSFYGAGGGIVWDSQAADEYDELHSKTTALSPRPQGFELLETMRWTPQGGVYLKDLHLRRLADSAAYFDFRLNISDIEQALDRLAPGLPKQSHRIRLRLAQDGAFTLQSAPVQLTSAVQPLALASQPVDTRQVWLYHKTTHRSVYEAAAAQVTPGCEALLYNQHGYLTESAIANLVYELAGKLYTPPVSDGLLPGTLRAHLLQQDKIAERSLHMDEMFKVQAWFLVNALRGWRTARLVPQDASANVGG